MKDLGLTDISASATAGGTCGCGGVAGACMCGHGEGHGHGHAEAHAHGERAAAGQTYAVAGMTCSHCVSSVTEELSLLDGVESVAVDLRPGAASSVVVTASRTLGDDEVRAAVEEAGYTLAR